jgi:hypothetical protein
VVSGLDKLLDQSQCVEYDMNQFLAELKERTSASHVQCKEKNREHDLGSHIFCMVSAEFTR